MLTAFEMTLGLLVFADPDGIERAQRIRAQRIRATLAWVRASCARDGLPAWLIEMVIERVQRELLAGAFPLLDSWVL